MPHFTAHRSTIGHWSLVIALFALLTTAFTASAQNPPPATAPVSFRDRILSRFQTALEANDDEWKLLEPKLIKIFLLRLDATVLPSMFNRGGPGGGFRSMIRTTLDPNALPSQVEEKSQELQALVNSNETSNSAYTNALAQLRKAREKANEDLAAAQKDLTSLLTLRQEATLVQMGLLD